LDALSFTGDKSIAKSANEVADRFSGFGGLIYEVLITAAGRKDRKLLMGCRFDGLASLAEESL
jgi:hypothetical protein